MRFLLRLVGLVVVALALSAGLLGLVKPVADWLLPGRAYDFGEPFRRLAEILALVGGYWLWKRHRDPAAAERAAELGRASWLFFGFLVGTTSLTLLLLVEVRTGALRVAPAALDLWLGRAGRAMVSAVLLAVFEETIFRGFLLVTLRREVGLAAAIGVSSVVFAACHYFVAHVTVVPGAEPFVGWRVLAAHWNAAADPSHLASLLGLAFAGAALAAARLLSGTLACAIGLHVGWVFLFKSARLVVQPSPMVRWLYGPDGVAGRPETWLALLAVIGVLALPRLRTTFGVLTESRRT